MTEQPSHEHTSALIARAEAAAADRRALSAYVCGCWPAYNSCRCHDRDIRNIEPSPTPRTA